MKYVIAAVICGGLAPVGLSADPLKTLSLTELDGVYAGKSAVAGATTLGVGTFVLGNSGTAAGSNQHDTVAGATPTSAVASGHGYGIGFGGGTAATSGATTTANGNVVFNMTLGGSGTNGPVGYSTTTSASSGGFCFLC